MTGTFARPRPPAALERWRRGDGSFWIVVEGGEIAEVVDWLRTSGHDPVLLDLFLERGHTARFLPLADAVYFEAPVVSITHPEKSFPARFLCLDRLVVQFQDSSAGPTDPAEFALTSRLVTLCEPSTSALVSSLQVAQSMRVRDRSLTLRAEARRLAARMDASPESVTIDEIATLKRNIRDLDEIVDEQLAVFTLLKALQSTPLDMVRIAQIFQVAVTNTESSDRAVDRLTRQAADLQGSYDLHQQDKTNHRLEVLTILSAVFLPLSLLTGIYGMNFDVMPELHFRYGYLTLLAGMAALTGGLLWYFRSHGWVSDTRRESD